MNDQYTSKERNKLKLKMATIFRENIRMLSTELKEMLMDDLVTAFENRMKVLNEVQSDVQIEMAESFEYETI